MSTSSNGQAETTDENQTSTPGTETNGAAVKLNKEAVTQYLQTHPNEWGDIKVKKGEEEVSFAEGIDKGLRQSDYTRKMQALAKERETLAGSRPPLTRDEVMAALNLGGKPAEPVSPFSDPDLAAKWGEEQIVNDPVNYARALAAEQARTKKEFDTRLKQEVETIKNDIKNSRASDSYARDVASVQAVIPEFSAEKNPALWHLAHQAFLGKDADKPNPMLENKVPATMTFAEVAQGIQKHITKMGEASFNAQQEAAKKRRAGAVTAGPGSVTEVSYPAEIEAIKDPRARMKARGEYMLTVLSGGNSG